MVLEARPHVTAVALDSVRRVVRLALRKGISAVERLRANLCAAGVEARATIQPGDMRRLPFEPATFDAVVSCTPWTTSGATIPASPSRKPLGC